MTDGDPESVNDDASTGEEGFSSDRTGQRVSSAWNSPRGLKARRLLDRYFVFVLLFAVVLAAAGGVLSYTGYADPGTISEERVETEWRETGGFSHEATVTNESAVFDLGESLQDRETYYTRISPRLAGTYRYEYAAAAGDLDATITLSLLLRSTSGGETLWERREEIDNQTVSGLAPDEAATASFELDVPAIQRQVSEIEGELGSSAGETEILIEASVHASGSVSGGPVETGHTNTFSIDPGGSTYAVDTPGTYTDTHQRVVEEPVERSYGPFYTVFGPAALLVGLLLGGALGGLRHRGAVSLSASEHRRLRQHTERSRFDDWITTGAGSSPIDAETRIETDSLEGLVDVAVDTNSRVIEDPTRSLYYVVDDVLYTYAPKDRSVDSGPGVDPSRNAPTESSGERDGDIANAAGGDPVVPDGSGERSGVADGPSEGSPDLE